MDVRWVALDTASSESGGMECLGVFFIPQGKGNSDGQYGDVLRDVGDKGDLTFRKLKPDMLFYLLLSLPS